MKPFKLFFFSLTISYLGFGVFSTVPKELKPYIPTAIDIESPEYASQRTELIQLANDCGLGVFTQLKGKLPPHVNRCAFNVSLDSLFFTKSFEKTGLLQDTDWAYKPGVTWVVPSRLDVPDQFDLRDLMTNGQPVIKSQNCGDCWAWATHHGLEISRAVHELLPLDLSIQTVLSCSKAGSCGGGYMSAVSFLKHGLPMENEFSYRGSDVSCKFSSSQINTGWTGKIIDAPYIGQSLEYSRGNRRNTASLRADGTKVTQMMAAMYQWKAPLVVTVAAYSISGDGIYSSCSSINSGGDHMVDIVGWDTTNAKRIAHVWNSWGQSHGKNGVSRIQWECGAGKLNRGLGYSARVVQYKAPCTPPDASQMYLHEIAVGGSVEIGKSQAANTTCSWLPTDGLDNPNSCVTKARPTGSTEYHLTATNECGSSSSMTLVDVWGKRGKKDNLILTPFGNVNRE